MTRGYLYLAFGAEYDKLAAHTIAKSMEFVRLPVTVISNVKDKCEKWNSIQGVNFINLNYPDDDNRGVRTSLINYTPYDETLYIDCDSVIVKPGIEKIFDLLNGKDAVFQQCYEWLPGKRYFKIYRDAARLFSISLPWKIFNGGFFAFRKTYKAYDFFVYWYDYWRIHSVGRDMPAMAAAVRNSGLTYATVTKEKDKFFSFGMTSDAIVLHRIKFDDLNRHFGIPIHNHNKKFDEGNAWFWEKVYFDDEENKLVNDPWIKTKFDRARRVVDKKQYIEKFLPEIFSGGLDVLDIATGPGEFIELAMEFDCKAIGIEGFGRMLERPIDTLYNRFSRLKLKEKGLPVIHADMNDVLKIDLPELAGRKFDIINCQLAINFIFSDCFNSHPELGAYRNNGEWIFNDNFSRHFNDYFRWCKNHLHKNGIVMLAALQAVNRAEYSDRIIELAEAMGYICLVSDGWLNHKFAVQHG